MSNTEQSAPAPNDRPATWDLVIEDCQSWASPDLLKLMRHRKTKGFLTYGVHLQAHNGRDSLVDALEEILDAMVYTKNAEIEEADPTIKQMIERAHQTAQKLAMSLHAIATIKRFEQAATG